VASWCVCNVQHGPLQSSKLRLALAYALDRQAIVNEPPHHRTAAFIPLPLIYTQQQAVITNRQREKAKLLFDEALQELHINPSKFPSLTLIRANNEVRQAMAKTIVSQWREVLGITVYTEGCDFRDLFSRMTKGNYQLGLMMWRNCVADPLYTLNAFKDSGEEINFSKWENARYQQLLDQAILEVDLKRKNNLMDAAEAILIDQMPVIPIAYETELFSRAEYIEGAIVSKIGNLDFKYVKIKKKLQNIEKIAIYRSS
jgi:oligopeptide transport system substrate-binding protein